MPLTGDPSDSIVRGGSSDPTGPVRIGLRTAVLVLGGIVLVATLGLLVLLRSTAARPEQTTPPPPTLTMPGGGAAPAITPVPDVVPGEPAPAANPAPSDVLSVTHYMLPNQTLSGVAALYGVALEPILSANNLSGNEFVQMGQQITIPLTPEHRVFRHRVQFGETLGVIAARYGLPIELIQSANNLIDPNAVSVGQMLTIVARPGDERALQQVPSEPVTEVSALLGQAGPQRSGWLRSPLEGDLFTGYPELLATERYRLHYQPGTYPEAALNDLVLLIDAALAGAEARVGPLPNGSFDIYAAGTLFAAPYAGLRDTLMPEQNTVFLLYDGSGTPEERVYFITQAVTRYVAWQVWGAPSSTLILHGLAASTAASGDSEMIPARETCAALAHADLLPSMVGLEHDWQGFISPAQDFTHFVTAGCFVSYLEQRCGRGGVQAIYQGQAYSTACELSLGPLEEDWRAALSTATLARITDPARYAARLQAVSTALQYALDNYDGSETAHLAYAAADQARSAVWRGDLEGATSWLEAFTSLTGHGLEE